MNDYVSHRFVMAKLLGLTVIKVCVVFVFRVCYFYGLSVESWGAAWPSPRCGDEEE